jgi:hypothetical protein
MKRLQKAAVLAKLIEKMRDCGSWCGETHVQKAVYFLQELLRVPVNNEFILYKHGPFSFDLRDEITDFRAYELFRLEPQAKPYGPRLNTTENVKNIKERYPNTLEKLDKQIDFVANKLDGKGVAELERLATALYVTRLLSTSKVSKRAKEIQRLKPHVTKDQALEAVKEFDKLSEEAEPFFFK